MGKTSLCLAQHTANCKTKSRLPEKDSLQWEHKQHYCFQTNRTELKYHQELIPSPLSSSSFYQFHGWIERAVLIHAGCPFQSKHCTGQEDTDLLSLRRIYKAASCSAAYSREKVSAPKMSCWNHHSLLVTSYSQTMEDWFTFVLQ